MPGEARLGIADGLTMGVNNVGQEENFWIAREGILRPGAPFEGPKAPREAQQVLWRQVLVAHDNDGMPVIGCLNGTECRLVHVRGKINTDDLGAKGGTAGMNGQTKGMRHP
jgi:hypothetical protein